MSVSLAMALSGVGWICVALLLIWRLRRWGLVVMLLWGGLLVAMGMRFR
jgi:hypothetical protein